MDLSVDDRRVNQYFAPPGRAVAVQDLSVNPFVGTILTHAGPSHKIVGAACSNFRRVLVPKRKGVHPPHGSASQRARKWPRKNVPTVIRICSILLTPGCQEPSVGARSHTRVCANICAGVNQKLAAHRRPINIIHSTIDIDARRAGCRRPAFLLGNPHNDKPAVAQRRNGWRALIEGNKLVYEKFTAAFCPRWCEDLSVNVLHAAAAHLVIAGPGDNHVAVCQRRNRGRDLHLVRKCVHQNIIRQPRPARREKTGVYVLKSFYSTLPGEDRPTVL